jgi:uncharacterized sulfatase
MRVAALLALTLLAAGPREERINVVLILADDLGWGDLACFGHPRFKTPHLDRMAAEGAKLTNFTTPVAFCAPTRAALLTGRYSNRCGLTQNPAPDGGPRADAVALPAGEVTIADLFRKAGYRTGCFGKWHLGHQPPFLPTRRGFDEYLGIPYSNDMRPVKLFEGESAVEYPVVQATLTRRLTERALAFIERSGDRPFFLYLPHPMPHKPLAASEDFYKKSGAGLYGDALAELDWGVGQMFEKLKSLGLEKRTLVLFTSDNGPWYGGSAGGLRGMKGQNWEGGLRVPTIARWPGRIPAGLSSHEAACTMDLFATALAAGGVEGPKDRTIDGKDLLPLLSAPGAKSPHEAVFSVRQGQPATVKSGKWKLHLVAAGPAVQRVPPADEKWIDPRAPDGVTILAPYEQAHPSQFPGVSTGVPAAAGLLFDLEADPAEQKDVAKEHPDVVARLKELAEKFKADVEHDRRAK